MLSTAPRVSPSVIPAADSRGRLRILLPVLWCAAGLLLAHDEIILSGFGVIPTDTGDTRFVHYLLEHEFRWATLQPGHGSLWSPAFFYPAENVGAYSEILLGAVPFYAPWRALASPDTALQLWILTIGVLNFAAMYLLLGRGFRLSAPAAALGATLFAFGGPRVIQSMHYQLFPQFWSVIALYALVRLFRREADSAAGRRRWIWIFTLGCVAQLWSGFYLGWFLALGLCVATAVALALPAARRALFSTVRNHYGTILLAGALAAVLLAPMAMHYASALREVEGRWFSEVRTMVPHPRAWTYHGSFSWLYSATGKWKVYRSIPMEHEQRMGVGYFTMLACCAGLWLGRRRLDVRLVALTGLATLLLASQYGGPLAPWRVIYEFFPGGRAIRGVSRICVLLLIPYGLGLALALHHLQRRVREAAGLRRYAAGAAAFVLVAVSIVEQGQSLPAFDKAWNREEIADIARQVDPARCDAFLLTVAGGTDASLKYHLDAMWAQLESGVPTVNGYSGFSPPGWQLGEVAIRTDEDDRRVERALRDWVGRHRLDAGRLCRVRLRKGPVRPGAEQPRP